MAQIDARIPLGVQPVQIENPLNAMAKVLQVQSLQREQEMGRLAMEDRTTARDRRNRLDSILQGGGDAKALRQGGFLKESIDLEESASKRAKESAAAGKDEQETRAKQYQFMANVLRDVRDQVSYDRAKMLAQSYGMDVSQVPPQYDPGFVAQTAQAFTTQAQAWTDQRQREQQVEVGRHNQATERTAAGQLAVSQGNLGLRRQELDHSRSQPRGQFIETTNGYVLADPKSGDVRPVNGPDGKPLRGKAADRSLNETQAKANLFGTRMREADRILASLDGKYSPAAVDAKMGADNVPLIGGLAGAIGNAMLSSEGQQAEQAQRDFINAVLRRESGAAIAASEFSNARKQYFPEPNDSPEKKAQKARNRALAIQGLEAEVPGGFRGAPTLTGTGQQGGASGEWGGGPGKVVDFGSLK